MKKTKLTSLSVALILAHSIAMAKEENEIFGGAVPGSLTAGTATYTIANFDGEGTDNTTWRSDLQITDGVAGDLLWANGWSYRLSTDTQENGLGLPDSASYNAGIGSFVWNDVNGLGLFSVTLTLELTQPAAGQAVLLNDIFIENISDDTINLTMFSFQDFDVNGSFAGDSADLSADPAIDAITIIDAGDTAEYRAGGNSAYQVSEYNGVFDLLTDAAINDLDNSGLPFGPGDFTGAFQWAPIDIPRFATYSIETTSGFGVLAPPADPPVLNDDVIWRNGFEAPNGQPPVR